jgi:TetR/AcrR family transcriptional regulator
VAQATTEEKILEAAVAEFAKYGFEGARIDRIAKRAKINKAMIYYHFKGKEALYRRIISDISARIYSFIMDSMPGDDDPLRKIETVMSRFIQFTQSVDVSIVQIILRELANGGRLLKDIVIPRLHMPMIQFFVKALQEGKEKGVFRDVNPYYSYLQLFGGIVMLNGMRLVLPGNPLYDVVFPPDYVEQFTENMLTVFTKGISAAGGE